MLVGMDAGAGAAGTLDLTAQTMLGLLGLHSLHLPGLAWRWQGQTQRTAAVLAAVVWGSGAPAERLRLLTCPPSALTTSLAAARNPAPCRLFAHRGIPLPAVRHLARQVLVALDYLHTTCRIIHTDLKPENVMLTEPVKPRRIDRGGGPTADQPLAGGERGDSQPPAAPSVAAPQPAAPSGGRPSKLQAVMAAGQPLTRNQKKKLKAKAKKKGGEGGSEASASMADSGIKSDTSGGVVQGQEASSGEAGGAQAAAPAAAANGTHPPSQPQQQQRAEAAAAVDAANAPLQQAGADPSLAAEADQPADLERAASGRGSPPVAVDLKDLADRLMQMDCKIVDFGNACWTHKHFTDDIQTRQYRSPEVSPVCQKRCHGRGMARSN